MEAPYTGTIHEVDPSNVRARLDLGYRLLDGFEEPEAGSDPEPPDEREAPRGCAGKPTAESTVAEIRAWCRENGVQIPAGSNKAKMLRIIG